MRYCHNPDCSHYRTVGRPAEYQDDADQCSDCERSLLDVVPDLPTRDTDDIGPPDLVEWEEMTKIGSLGNEAMVLAVESLLTEAGIRFAIHGRNVQDLFGLGRIGAGFNVFAKAPVLFVEDGREEEVRELLAVLESDADPEEGD